MFDDTQLPDLQETQAMLDNPQEAQEIPAQEQQEEQQVIQQPQQQPQQKFQQETEAQRNFKVLREERERLAKERDEMARRIQELEMKAIDAEISIGDEDIVEGKHLKAFNKKQAELQSRIKEYEQRLEEVTLETRIKSQYPDFSEVFNESSIARLRNEHPEIAATIAMGDRYSAAVSAYKIIKQFNLNGGDPYAQDKQRAQTNASKPRPSAAIAPQQGGSPLEKANAFDNGLTEELRKQLVNEMKSAMRNR